MYMFGKTDIGCVREINQDSFKLLELGGAALAIVCDGMGGAKAGNIASEMAVNRIACYVEKSYFPYMDEFAVEKMLRSAVESANIEVFKKAEENIDYSGMGTTAVAALIREGTAYIIHVGDSRAYLIDGGISQITEDHSVIQSLLSSGQITAEEARNHPKKNIITRAVGTRETVESDFASVNIKGAQLLLCTDGLSGMLSEAEMLEIIRNNEPEEAVQALIDAANEKNSHDNVTAVLMADI